MIIKRPAEQRGPTDIGWLKSMHSFSFGGYHDPAHMGFSTLRVINEDRVAPAKGFDTHPHSNMEIISYVLSGELAHEDSMGNGASIKPGEIQIMSAGSGVTHSEFNASNDNEAHFLQIWITPNVNNQEPNYQQMIVNPDDIKNQFATVISSDDNGSTLHIKQDAQMMVGVFETNHVHKVTLKTARKYWLQIVRGNGTVNGTPYNEGDGFAFDSEDILTLDPNQQTEALLFDLPI